MLKKIMAKANANKKNQKGFTLIELLAVIVILAILAAIAIPSVISIINKQNDKAAVQDAVTAIHAAKLYAADHNVTATTTISASDLNKYIDNSIVNKLPPDYEVTLTNSNGSTSYTIKDSKLGSVDGLTGSSGVYTEKQLLQFNGVSTSSSN